MSHMNLAVAALFPLALMPALAGAQELHKVQPSPPLTLESQGSFYVGGNSHTVPAEATFYIGNVGANAVINQMYVQFERPVKHNAVKLPIVLVHGCCLSAKSWETTPDGRMGWYEYFTRRGFDTYAVDQVSRGRSGFDASPYQKALAGTAQPNTLPKILIATDALAWVGFRWGDFATLTPFPDERFPMNTVGVGPGATLDFYKQFIPDTNATLGVSVNPDTGSPADPDAFFNTPAALAQLANDLNGAILVAHSEASAFPTEAALRPNSHGIRGIIQLETGCYGNLTAADIQILKKIPILIVVADHFTIPQPDETCAKEIQQINGAGGDITFLSLPAIGIHGNSHMMMMDNNNLQIADILIEWIDKHVRPHMRHN